MKVPAQRRSLAGILIIAALLLTGCPQPGAQTTAQTTAALPAPTQAPTLPPAVTPSPPQELSPTPRPTSTLTPIPAPIATATAKTNISPEAYMTLLALGNSLYQSGTYEMAAALYTEMLDRELNPKVYSLRAETYSDATDASLKAMVTQRQEWIDALQGGANPITPEVLAQLRDAEIAVAFTSECMEYT